MPANVVNIFDNPTNTIPISSPIKLTNIFGNEGDVVSDNFPISNIVADNGGSVTNIEQTPQQTPEVLTKQLFLTLKL
jgi:hypothetical protein